jgi:hypothetical protein
LKNSKYLFFSGPGRRSTATKWSGCRYIGGGTIARQQTMDEVLEPIDGLSAPELLTMRKYALLKLTALMERHTGTTIRSNNGSWNGVQRLLRKFKNPDNKLLKGWNIIMYK